MGLKYKKTSGCGQSNTIGKIKQARDIVTRGNEAKIQLYIRQYNISFCNANFHIGEIWSFQ